MLLDKMSLNSPNKRNAVAQIRQLFTTHPKYSIPNNLGAIINQESVIKDVTELHQDLINLILSDKLASSLFIKEINGFKLIKQIELLNVLFSMQDHMNGSFTSYDNKIGAFVTDNDSVILSFPYKDCVLVGGMTKEDTQSSSEVFYNEIIEKDKIDRLFEPKIFTKAFRYSLSKDSDANLNNSANIKVEPVSKINFLNIEDDYGQKLEKLSENLLIKGNNLLALHTLSKRLHESVDIIYIDPPYYFREKKSQDTFLYNSNFKLSSWLVFMKNRLEIAKQMLSRNGFICISISEDGHAHLKLLCDDIFGVDKFVGDITWEKRTKSQNTKTAKDRLQSKTEFILMYKNFDGKPSFHLNQNGVREYPEKDEKSPYRLKSVDEMSSLGMRGRETMIFPITGIMPRPNQQWKIGKDEIAKYESRGDVVIISDKVFLKQRPEDEDGNTYDPFWSHFFDKDVYGTAETGKAELSELLGTKEHGFETVKPVALIKNMLSHIKTTENPIIMDFFGGSGSTAHAVMQMNKEDCGNRRFILVEQLEYAESLTANRIKRSIIKNEYKEDFIFIEMMRDSLKDQIQGANSINDVIEIINSNFESGAFQYVDSKETLISEITKSFSSASLDSNNVQFAIKHLIENYFDHNTEYKSICDFIEYKNKLSKEDVNLNVEFHQLGK